MSICPVTTKIQPENWIDVNLSHPGRTSSILKVNTTVFSMIASFLSVPERAALSITCQGLSKSADLFLWQPIAVKMNVQHLRDKYGGYNQAIQNALKTDAFSCFVINPFVSKLTCNFKINSHPDYKPSTFDQDSSCSIALSSFKELVQEHFNTYDSPYFAALVKDNKKYCALYDLNALSAYYASKNWAEDAFNNPMTRALCEHVRLYGITKFGAFALGTAQSSFEFKFYFKQFENVEGAPIVKPATCLTSRLASAVLSGVLRHGGFGFSDAEILNWLMLKLSEENAVISIIDLANFILRRDSKREAHLLLDRIAKRLSSRLLFTLGLYYQRIENSSFSKELAFACYTKAAKDFNLPEALYRLGFFYQNNIGVVDSPLNKVRAFECYKKAAGLNHPEALYSLGLCYKNNIGVASSPLNTILAFECYRKAAKDFNLPEAWFELGLYYNYDMGDRALAFCCYKKAADLNHPPSFI